MKQKLSFKYKIYAVVAGVFILALVFFMFIYGMMDSKNRALAGVVSTKNKEYQGVLAEQQAYDSGKKDLHTLESKPVQPDDLFSQDTKVVKEIKILESLAQAQGVDFSLQVSGTVKNTLKLPNAASPLNIVPYGMVLQGPFDKVVNFIEMTEHLSFVTHTNEITVSALTGASVRAQLSSEFYIRP